jgi:hypothetical protein
MFTVNWVNSVSEISPDLFERCFRPPLEGRWWYDTLEKSNLQDQFKFEYAVIMKGDRPVGIAPTFFMNVPMDLVAPPEIVKLLKLVPAIGKIFPFLVYQRTLFVGSPCSDEGTVGLIPGIALSDVTSSLQEAFYKRAAELKAHMVVWKDFAPEDTLALESLITEKGMFPSVSYPGTRVQLPPGGMTEYYKTLKGSRRHKLLKKLRKSKERLRLDVEIVQRPAAEVLDQVWTLFEQTYEQAETKFERLNRQFFDLIAQQEVSRFVLVRNHDSHRIVAFMLCFQLGDRIINKFIGLDYSQARTNYLYFRLWEVAIEWAMSTGASELQSGQTGYSAKIDIGNSLIPLTNYCRHRNPIVHWFYKTVAKTVSWSTIDKDLDVYLTAHPEHRYLSVVPDKSVAEEVLRVRLLKATEQNKSSREIAPAAALVGERS